MAPFAGLPDEAGPGAWSDLAELVGAGREAVLFRGRVDPPEGWEVVGRGAGVQLVATGLEVAHDPAAVRLGVEHAEEMLELVSRTRPGPFLRRTPVLGSYLGIRDGDGALVAMAGERLRLDGWTEISAVCTDEGHRGRGLGTRLVRAVAAGIVERGGTPFLHAAADNRPAIRLYASMGFTFRREVVFARLRAPGGVRSEHGS
ncbi:GNAT family N-acetyltransferase [Acidiferrimicrobium sp. IK]|nr:GNAT family N-acetyltransferase [Acidiferrimicrobium sp. IK]MCU4185293.1 GNAT family N-acetyltransferase [Acidiferrimicrobium sp. IK]